MPFKCACCEDPECYAHYKHDAFDNDICGECYDFLTQRNPPLEDDELYKYEGWVILMGRDFQEDEMSNNEGEIRELYFFKISRH